MKLILARHAETIENVKKHSQGHSDGTLTRKGKTQAKKLAIRLANEDIDIIYCSDLGRCKETLKPFLKIKKIPVIYTKELRERNTGIFQGRPHEEMKKWYETIKKKKPEKSSYDLCPPRGESYNALRKRISRSIEKILKKERNKNILIVSHGGPLVAILLHLFQKEPKTHYKKYRMSNAAITLIKIREDGSPKITRKSETDYLD